MVQQIFNCSLKSRIFHCLATSNFISLQFEMKKLFNCCKMETRRQKLLVRTQCCHTWDFIPRSWEFSGVMGFFLGFFLGKNTLGKILGFWKKLENYHSNINLIIVVGDKNGPVSHEDCPSPKDCPAVAIYFNYIMCKLT